MVLRRRGFNGTAGNGEGPDAPPTARWLAFAAACLLVAAMVSAGVIGFGDGPSSDAVVSAAGRTASTIGLPSTVTVPPPSTTVTPPAPTTTIRTTTTLPRAAVEVLKAIGTTAPSTTAPAPTAPPTTRAPSTTVAPPTTTTTPPRVARVKVTNSYGHPLRLAVNGSNFNLVPDESVGPVDIGLPAGDDFIQVTAGDPPCTGQLNADYFQSGGNYQVTVVAATGTLCANGLPTPVIEVTRL